MSNIDFLARNFIKTLVDVQSKKSSPYDTQAEVRRVDGDTAWVHIPGGVDETPVQLTTNAKKGDIVQVRVSGGRAWLYGNATAPPTDDTRANEANKVAVSANEHAINAVTEAGIAKEAADSAQASAAIAKAVTDEIEGYAQTVSKTVTQVLEDGETAGIAAQQASEAATSALKGLASVEDVVDTLNWIATHCEYEKTTDQTIVTGKAYYTVTATQVSSPTDEDIVTYYELVSGEYVKTSDTSVVSGKDYYTVVGEPVTNPVVADIDTYYELEITEAVSNYINTHVAVTDEGLWLIPDDRQGSNKVLIAVGGQGHTYEDAGTYIIDGNGNVLAQFLENGAQIGQSDNTHVEINNNSLDIKKGTATLSQFTSNMVSIGGAGTNARAYIGKNNFKMTRLYGDNNSLKYDLPYPFQDGVEADSIRPFQLYQHTLTDNEGLYTHLPRRVKINLQAGQSKTVTFEPETSTGMIRWHGNMVRILEAYDANGNTITTDGITAVQNQTTLAVTISVDNNYTGGIIDSILLALVGNDAYGCVICGNYHDFSNWDSIEWGPYWTRTNGWVPYPFVVGTGGRRKDKETGDYYIERKNGFTVDWSGRIGINNVSSVASNDDAYIKIRHSSIDSDGTAPASTVYSNNLHSFDTDGTRIGYIENWQNTSNTIGINIGAARKVNGSMVYNSITANVDANGKAGYALSSPNAFKKALSLGDAFDINAVPSTARNINIGATTNATGHFSVKRPGWKAISCCGWNLNNQESGGQNVSLCVPYGMFLNTQEEFYYEIRNNASSQAKITIQVYILYVKVTY